MALVLAYYMDKALFLTVMHRLLPKNGISESTSAAFGYI